MELEVDHIAPRKSAAFTSCSTLVLLIRKVQKLALRGVYLPIAVALIPHLFIYFWVLVIDGTEKLP